MFWKWRFYNGQFTAICWTAYFRWKPKNVKKKTVSMRLLWESIKCYTDDFKNKKMLFRTLLDSINFLQKYFENFGPIFWILRFLLYTFCTRSVYLKHPFSNLYRMCTKKILKFKKIDKNFRNILEEVNWSVRKNIFLFLKSSV